MPLQWHEVNSDPAPRDFTVRNTRARIAALGSDPLVAILDDSPDLLAALEGLL